MSQKTLSNLRQETGDDDDHIDITKIFEDTLLKFAKISDDFHGNVEIENLLFSFSIMTKLFIIYSKL